MRILNWLYITCTILATGLVIWIPEIILTELSTGERWRL